MSSPAYSRLHHQLVLQIENGIWQPGDQLPPERVLAESHGLSVGTVRKAMDMLVQGGYCYRVQGKGTFVSEYTREAVVFYRMRTEFSAADAELTTRNVKVGTDTVPPEAAPLLRLAPGAACIRISRILQGRDKTGSFLAGCSTSWFSLDMCSALLETDVSEFQRRTLYHLVEERCGIPSVHCDEFMTICTELPEELHDMLSHSVLMPCFHLKMVSFTYERKPFEYRESYIFGVSRGLVRRHDFRR